MSDLQTAFDELKASEEALKARVTAHEQKDADTTAALQAQIDALEQGNDSAAVVEQLKTLKADIDAFDAAPAPAATEDTPAAPPA